LTDDRRLILGVAYLDMPISQAKAEEFAKDEFEAEEY
jgi:hypothetical protein